MTINMKTETPDTSLPTTGYLIGADSQSAAAPSIYSMGVAQEGLGVNPHYMGVYISTPASTTISVAGTYYKLAGTTTAADKTTTMDDDSSTSNRIKYLGTEDRHFHVKAQVSLAPDSGTNQIVGIKIWHYDASGASGAYLTESLARAAVPLATTNIVQLVAFADVDLEVNDYLEIHVTNETGTVAVTAENATMHAAAAVTDL